MFKRAALEGESIDYFIILHTVKKLDRICTVTAQHL